MTLEEFLSKYSTALFTLAGALLGALASFLTASVMAQKEIRLRLREKLLDRRIEAHEHVIDLSHSMRAVRPLGGLDAEGELARTPAVLISKEVFDDWFNHFYQTMTTTSTWLGMSLIHELNLLQDYVVNLNEFLRQVPTENYQRVGQIIRLDFIHFSESIEKLAFEFFTNDLEKLRISRLPKWHKYPLEETEKRIRNTDLFKHRNELQALVRAK